MSQNIINTGQAANDGTGEPLRQAFTDINNNFSQIWTSGPVNSNVQITDNRILTLQTNQNLVLSPNGIGLVQANTSIVPDIAHLRDLGSSAKTWDTVWADYVNAQSANIAGDVVIEGNLQVNGNVTYIDSNVVEIKDKNITLAYGSPTAQAANGGGITIDGANAQLYYNYSNNSWTTNITIAPGNITFPDGSVLDTANTVHIGQTPIVKGDGNLWFNSDDGRGYVKYNDQWIEFSPTVIPNPSVYLGNLTIDGAENSTLYFPPGGAIVFGDDTVQTTAWTGTANVNFANVASSIIPSANLAYSLGNSTRWWANAWFGSNTIYIGGVPVGTSGNTLTVNGADVATTAAGAAGNPGDIQINVDGGIGADSGLRYVDDGGEMTLFADYMNSPGGLFTNDIMSYPTGNIYITTDTGNAVTWNFTTRGNLSAPGAISAVGNITGSYIIGNGSQLTGLPAGYSNSNATTLLANFGSNTISTTGNITSGNIYTGGIVSATGTVTGSYLYSSGAVSAAGNVVGSNVFSNAITLKNSDDFAQILFSNDGGATNNGQIKVDGGTNMVISAGSNFYVKRAGQDRIAVTDTTADFMAATNVRIQSNKSGSAYTWTFDNTGNVSLPGNVSATGNITGNYILGNGSALTSVATQVTGSWTLSAGTNTVSFTIPTTGTYSIWVNGNIPLGIVTYTATIVLTNNNVPVVGSSYAWYYAGGNALVWTSIPNQIVGTNNAISNAAPAVSNTNVFTFGIDNNSGSSQVVNWGYTKL
jgi:hypothetical protein